jgi:predicted nucleotidyltransferase
MSQARDADGKFVEKISIDAVLESLESANEPVTAKEIAARLDIPKRTALDKLNELSESDPTVSRKQVGAHAVIWFIRHGPLHEQAFETFADRLTDAVGEHIEEIILYGSVARGEAHDDSDVDVLIVIEDELGRETVREHASSIGIDVMIEYDVSISTMVKTNETMEEHQGSSFLQNVQNDGLIYG